MGEPARSPAGPRAAGAESTTPAESVAIRDDLAGRRRRPRPGHRAAIDPMRLHPCSPLRPPSWRWLRAGVLADGDRPPSRSRDDAAVARALDYRRGLRRCRGAGDRRALAERWPDLDRAHDLFAGEPPTRRWALEALVLADVPAAVIAGRLGVTAGAIAAYERTFFDVRASLEATDYILWTVIGLVPGKLPADEGTVWRLVAYCGGVAALDFMMGIAPAAPCPEHPDQVAAFMDEQVRDRLLRLGLVAAVTAPVDALSVPRWLDLYARTLRGRRGDREATPLLEAIRPNVAAMEEALAPIIGGVVRPAATGAPTTGPDVDRRRA
jgi:hypothetical protein